MENDNSYDELKRDAKLCLSLMSQGLLYPQQVPLILQVLSQVSTWLQCIQHLIFVPVFFSFEIKSVCSPDWPRSHQVEQAGL